jgi:peptidyl-dipeptidase A
MKKYLFVLAAAALLTACDQSEDAGEASVSSAAPVLTAQEFVDQFNAEYKDWWRELNAAGWVGVTYINEDSGIVDSLANQRFAAWHAGKVDEAKQYDDQELDSQTRRALGLLKSGAQMVAPNDDAKRKELSTILTEMKAAYGSGKYCRSDEECLSGNELELKMSQSKDFDELLVYWVGWRKCAPPMRD